MTVHVSVVEGDDLSDDIIDTIDALLIERQQEDQRGSLVITVEGDRFSGKTTVLDEIANRHVGPKVRVRPRRDKKMSEGACVLLGAKAFTQERGHLERYAGFRRVVERAASSYGPDSFLDVSVTTDFLALVEEMLPAEHTIYILLDDFESFDDLSKDLYPQLIDLTSRIDCVVIATSTSTAALSLLSASHRLRIAPMSVRSVINEVEAVTGIAPPRAVAKQLRRMTDGARGIVREIAQMLTPSQLTGASHISSSLPPGPLAADKAEPMVRLLPEHVAGALAMIAFLEIVTVPLARVIADLAGASMQELLSVGCLTVSGGRVRISSGVVQRTLAQLLPQLEASDLRWREVQRASDTPALSGTESMHIAMCFEGNDNLSTSEVVDMAATASEQGGSDSARLLLTHAWGALSSPDTEALAGIELNVALEDARFIDVLESTDAELRDLPPGAARLQTIAARLDAAHVLYEHSSFDSAMEEYQRHRTEHPEPVLRHLLDSAERSFDLGLRDEGLELLTHAADLQSSASPAARAEYEFLHAWQIDGADEQQLSKIIGAWWQANRSHISSIPTRFLQALAAADPSTARYFSRESAIRPVSRSRRMRGLLAGAEADLDDELVDSAIRQLDALDDLAHPSAFHPLRRATARLTASVLRSQVLHQSSLRRESDLAEVSELRSALEHLRADSPALAARAWIVTACWNVLAGCNDAATEAVVNAWRASRPLIHAAGGDALLQVALPLVLRIRTAPGNRADPPSALERSIHAGLTALDPRIDTRDLMSAARELARSQSLTRRERTILMILAQQDTPGTGSAWRGTMLAGSAALAPTGNRLAALSPREREVALRAINGERNREIGAQMFLSLRTVEATLTQIYRKLNVGSKLELAAVLRDERPLPRAATAPASD